MSVSSMSTTAASPPPSYTDSSESSQPAHLQRPENKPNDKDGDEVAAAQQQSARAPLPPGQGTRVNVLA